MSEEQYSFENIPEENRFYYIVQWGMPPSMEEESKRQEEDVAANLQLMDVFNPGLQEDVAHIKEMQQREWAVGFSRGALSPPRWTEAEFKWVHDPEGPEYLEAPTLFTIKEAAEALLRDHHDHEGEGLHEPCGQLRL